MLRLVCISVVLAGLAQTGLAGAERALVEAGKFTEVFDPKAGERDPWCINDHTIIRGPDGTWHLFGITHILPVDFFRDPGKNLLHATAQTLTQSPWHKEAFAVLANWDKHKEWFFWAPHVIRHEGLYYMFVCVGNSQGHQYRIHLLTSKDLWHWERSPANPLLTDGFDARDPNVLRSGKEWILYYTATSKPEGGNHIVACVTSQDLLHWGGRKVVFTHPKKGTFGGPDGVSIRSAARGIVLPVRVRRGNDKRVPEQGPVPLGVQGPGRDDLRPRLRGGARCGREVVH